MKAMETIDEMYENMLKRCGVYRLTNDAQDSQNGDNGNISEYPSDDATSLRNHGLGYGIGFERIRRITGYISGDYVSRFNNAKKAEVEDRLTHNRYNRTEDYHE